MGCGAVARSGRGLLEAPADIECWLSASLGVDPRRKVAMRVVP